MAELLEMVQPIVDSTGRATPYFEDYIHNIIESIGGEGSSVQDISDDSDISGMHLELLERISSIEQEDFKVIELSQPEDSMMDLLLSKISALEARLKAVEDEL